jgi:hypothetical protein
MLLSVSAVAPAASAAASPPAAHAAVSPAAAAAFAADIAKAGAPLLIKHLKAGALGDTGKSIGNFLSDAGLGDPTVALLEEFKAVDARLSVLQQDSNAASKKLDDLLGAVATGNYSNLVAHANSLRSSVLHAAELLALIDTRPSLADRKAEAVTLVDFYKRHLEGMQRTFEGYLTGGAVAGADGILQLASKRSRSAARPFYTSTMSALAPDVYSSYAMVQAVWLELDINVLHYHKAAPHLITEAIARTEAAIAREGQPAIVPQHRVDRNVVVDTRTGLVWSWVIDLTPCSETEDSKAARQRFSKCLVDNGANVAALPFAAWTAAESGKGRIPANLPPPSPVRPTVDQLRALDTIEAADRGQPGGVPAWLHKRGGFPSALTGEVWTSPQTGTTDKTFNQSTGAVNDRPVTQSFFSLVVSSFDYGRPGAGYFWLE